MQHKKTGFAFIILALVAASCQQNSPNMKIIADSELDTAVDKKAIASMLDSFNIAASNADYNQYFNYFTEDAIFIGTDPSENWDKKSFMVWAKPAFDKKKTWHFSSIQRHIYFDAMGKLAWFDELLKTQMKICRGSGVLVKQGKDWRIKQYVLSMTIPNSDIDTVVKIKAPIEDSLIKNIEAGK